MMCSGGISVTTCIDELATDIALGLLDAGFIDDPQAVRHPARAAGVLRTGSCQPGRTKWQV